MKMKRFLALMLAGAMTVSLAACGGKGNGQTEDAITPDTAENSGGGVKRAAHQPVTTM